MGVDVLKHPTKHPTMLKPQYIKGLREFWVGCGVFEAYDLLRLRLRVSQRLLRECWHFAYDFPTVPKVGIKCSHLGNKCFLLGKNFVDYSFFLTFAADI